MKTTTINKRIDSAFKKHRTLCNLSDFIKDYFKEIIKLRFQSLELDDYDSTSSENLDFAIETAIYDDFNDIYYEALLEEIDYAHKEKEINDSVRY